MTKKDKKKVNKPVNPTQMSEDDYYKELDKIFVKSVKNYKKNGGKTLEDILGVSKQVEELKKITDEMTSEAKMVVEDYKDNPSEMSGSITQVNISSPILNKNVDNNN